MDYKLYYSPHSQQHETPQGHPECPQRLAAIVNFLQQKEQQEKLKKWQWHTPNEVENQWFAYAHPKSFVDNIFASAPQSGLVQIDADTYLSAGSARAVRLAGGALKQAIDDVILQQSGVAFCLNRPPGHHAERNQAMGFCLFSLLANAALYARQQKIERIAILDFDVHHGNGTEDVLRPYEKIFFASTYQQGIFPAGTRAKNTATRQIIPLQDASESLTFRRAWEGIFDHLQHFQPQLILLSAGFDAHINDPLASLCLHEEDYYWFAQQLKQQLPSGANKIVANLEGGYHLDSLSRSVAAFMEGLL